MPSIAAAVAGYLATLDHPETAGTRRVYASTPRQLVTHAGPDQPVTALEEPTAADELAAWFTGRWGQRAPATYNRNLDALRSAVGYWCEDESRLDFARPPSNPTAPPATPLNMAF